MAVMKSAWMAVRCRSCMQARRSWRLIRRPSWRAWRKVVGIVLHSAPNAADLAGSINGDVREAEEHVPLSTSFLQKPQRAAEVSVKAIRSQKMGELRCRELTIQAPWVQEYLLTHVEFASC